MTDQGFRTKINGVVHYDSRTTALGKYLTTIDTAGSNGSWTNASLLTGQIDWQVYGVSSTDTTAFSAVLNVSLSGDTLSWTYSNVEDGRVALNFYIVVWVV